MRNELTAIIERDGEWCIAYGAEVSGVNGQGKTRDEARTRLAADISLIRDLLAVGESSPGTIEAVRGTPRWLTALRQRLATV
jgi:predicted RNase H-like HicB family nuclease